MRKKNKPASRNQAANTSTIIFCEGETEQKYLKAVFRVETISGKGKSRQELLKHAKGYLKHNSKAIARKVWLVFDLDKQVERKNDGEDFDKAIKDARDEGFNVAYSNECVELWFAIHYEDFSLNISDVTAGVKPNKDRYYDFLKKKWGCKSENDWKGKSNILDMANSRTASLENAKTRAKELYDYFKHLPQHRQNPCTTIHLLFEDLEKKLPSGV